MTESKELVTTSGTDLQASVDLEKTNRDIIKRFVSDQLVKGTDYGNIVGSKPTLLKPGMEKIFSLMHLKSRLVKDTETYEMLGSTPGMVCYKAVLYQIGTGEEVAEGRGAAQVGDKKRDANATIKIAEKRARMDACLSLGFSEFFTQDLEDTGGVSPGVGPPPAARATEVIPGVRTSDPVPALGKMASDKQVSFVKNLMMQKAGVKSKGDAKRLFEQYGIQAETAELLAMDDAKLLIDTLLKLPNLPKDYLEDDNY
jgi:hypothetical protein